MAKKNGLSSRFHINMIIIVCLFLLITSHGMHVSADVDIFPLWDAIDDENVTESCFITIDKNITALTGRESKTCGVQLTSGESGIMVQIPEETSLGTFLYVKKRDALLDCQNRYVVIMTYNPCFIVLSLTRVELFLQGNTSVLISDPNVSQSSSMCPSSNPDNADSDLICHTKEFNQTISCSGPFQDTCVFELPSDCNATLGNKQIDFICSDNEFNTRDTTLILYPSNVTILNFAGGNVVEIIEDAFITLKNLDELDISYSRLSKVHARAFVGLNVLNILNLRGNVLQTLDNETFSGLLGLTNLHLDDNELTVLPHGLFNNLRKLKTLFLYSNQIDTLNENDFDDLHELKRLDLDDNKLTNVPGGLFSTLTKLETLWLASNQIQTLPNKLFNGLYNLHSLFLFRNELKSIDHTMFQDLTNLETLGLSVNYLVEVSYDIFWTLTSLKYLNLGYNQLSYLHRNLFKGLQNLQMLYLHFNKLHTIDINLFNGTSDLWFLDLSGNHFINIPNIGKQLSFFGLRENPLTMIDKRTFSAMPKNIEIFVSQTEICECYVASTINCTALDERSPYLTCDRLLSDRVLMVMMWIIGINALGGNIFVLIRKKTKNEKNKVQTFLLSNLAISDLLMGIYMLIISSADIYFGKYFPMNAETWRTGITCRIAGAVSIISSEASVFFVTLISIDRFINIRFPYSRRKLNRKSATVNVILLWLMSLVMAIIPSVLAGNNDKFYDNSHVCIGLPLAKLGKFTKDVSTEWTKSDIGNYRYRKWVVSSEYIGLVPGLYYSSAVFLGVNGISYFIILLCYVEIVRFVFKSSKRAGLNKDMKEQIRMTIKVAAIVLTDFACWSPIIVLGILVQTNVVVLPSSVFAWCVTVILPINSAINPYLYTIGGIISNRRKRAKIAPEERLQDTTPQNSNRQQTSGTRVTEVPCSSTQQGQLMSNIDEAESNV